jgi:uncharacterized protein
MQNAVNWFELPATDFGRAVRFYETIFTTQLRKEIFNGEPNAIFPMEGADSVGGAVVFRPTQKPTTDGALVYLPAAGKMEAVISRIAKVGGKVLILRTSIGNPGFISIFLDSEGNKVALHEPA